MKPRDYCCCAIPVLNAGIYAVLFENFVLALLVAILAVATPSSMYLCLDRHDCQVQVTDHAILSFSRRRSSARIRAMAPFHCMLSCRRRTSIWVLWCLPGKSLVPNV
jgi:hypothetical protein